MRIDEMFYDTDADLSGNIFKRLKKKVQKRLKKVKGKYALETPQGTVSLDPSRGLDFQDPAQLPAPKTFSVMDATADIFSNPLMIALPAALLIFVLISKKREPQKLSGTRRTKRRRRRIKK